MRTALLAALALCLASCATSQPATPYTQPPKHGADVGTPPSPGLPLYQQQVDSARTLPGHVSDIHVGERAAPMPSAPANPTRQQRKAYERQLKEWRKAQVAEAKARRGPLYVGKGAVNAPAAQQVVNAFKPAAPVVKVDSGGTAEVASTQSGPAVVGDGNDVPVTTEEAPGWQAVLAKYLGLAGAALLLGLICWYGWPLLPRRKKSTDNA